MNLVNFLYGEPENYPQISGINADFFNRRKSALICGQASLVLAGPG
jgi:hypothetical protein